MDRNTSNMESSDHCTKASPRILTVQSHVVTGYCGNKSASFPLQLLEYEVDIINTVQYSNHTQYSVCLGQIYSGEDLRKIHAGLKKNSLLQHYDFILSGFVANISYLEALADLIKDTKLERLNDGNQCRYSLDPVLGDDEMGFYVPDGKNLAESFKTNLVPIADIITPNRFEASVLTGIDIDCSSKDALSQAVKAMEVLHDMGVKLVVLTSFKIESNNDEIICLISHRSKIRNTCQDDEPIEDQEALWEIRVPKLDCAFTGTGDLFTALLTAWLGKTNFDIKKSFENTVNAIHEILLDTFRHYVASEGKTVRDAELRLVQNRRHIISPVIRFEANKLQR